MKLQSVIKRILRKNNNCYITVSKTFQKRDQKSLTKDIPAKLNNPKPLLKIKQTFQIKSRKVTHINAICQVKLYFDNKFGQVALHDSKCLQ